MKICFIVDGRSSHAQSWISYFISPSHEVHLISTYPCDPDVLKAASLHIVPLDFSARARAADNLSGDTKKIQAVQAPSGKTKLIRKLRGSGLWAWLAKMRDASAPLAIKLQAGKVRKIVQDINPDLVVAMRIPFEGMLAATAMKAIDIPLILQIWGNDFTLYAQQSPLLMRMTVDALRRTDALLADCDRDVQLARQIALDAAKPATDLAAAPVHTDIFHPGQPSPSIFEQFAIADNAPVIVNPRGIKPYIRNDVFFQSIPIVLQRYPNAIFLGASMQGIALAESWITRLGLEKSVRLLPFLSHNQMADVFRLSQVVLSLGDHDGIPNAILEAMSCGSFPITSGLASLREIVQYNVNGFICDQSSPESVASAIIRALDDNDLRARAAVYNQKLIAERSEYYLVMQQAERFYEELLRQKQHSSPAAGALPS